MKTVASCGCIFCDLDLPPSKDEETGKYVHVVWIGRKRRVIPCVSAAHLPAGEGEKSGI